MKTRQVEKLKNLPHHFLNNFPRLRRKICFVVIVKAIRLLFVVISVHF